MEESLFACVCVLVELNLHTDISEIQKDIIVLSKKKKSLFLHLCKNL